MNMIKTQQNILLPIIRLFKAVPVTTTKLSAKGYALIKTKQEALMEETIKLGFIIAPEVVADCSDLKNLVKLVKEEVGISAEQLNSSFHKSWKKVRDASIEQLVIEQIMHYVTTYGFEALGCYNSDTVYIPFEKLEIPELDEKGVKLTVIKGITNKELKEKLLNLLGSGVALAEDTIADTVDVATYLDLNEEEISGIKNKEVKIALYDYLNLVPKNPTEFLRFAVYRATGKTLLIKNEEMVKEIKEGIKPNTLKLFNDYEKAHGLEKLAEVFLRFKPLFLAFKGSKQLNKKINKIGKLAKTNHKPMPEDYLNNVTAKLKADEKVSAVELKKELEKVNTFRKIRLAYALKFRTKDVNSILYKVRNGKGYATEFKPTDKVKTKKVLDVVLESIIKDVSKNVKGKKIYIPENMNYSLPATEKQFTGDFPSGSYVTVPKNMVVGIHWEDLKDHRVDLDLSLISPDTGKIGWDGDYRTEDTSILFSGDNTSAPNGASELFYIKRQKKQAFIMFVNYYNYNKEKPVPFKIVVAKEEPKDFGQNHMVDPNNLVSVAKTKIDQKEKILGLLVTTTNESRFYFAETNIGKSITAGNSDFVEHARKYLFNFYEDTIGLKDVLVKAGAKIVDKEKGCDINLAPESLEKDTILELMR